MQHHQLTNLLEQLPSDCLYEIFKYLPFLPTVLNLQLVSSTFKNVIQYYISSVGGFELNLGFLPSHISLTKFSSIISRFHKTKQITLCNLMLTVDLMKVLSYSSIETLVLCNCSTEGTIPFSPDLVSSDFKNFKKFQQEMLEKTNQQCPFYNLKRVIVIDSSKCLNFLWNNFIERDESCPPSLNSFYNMESFDYYYNCWKFKSIIIDSMMNRKISFLSLQLYENGNEKVENEMKHITLRNGQFSPINIPIQSIESIEEKKLIMSKYGIKNNYRKIEFKSKTIEHAVNNFILGIYSFRTLDDLLINITKLATIESVPTNFITKLGIQAELIYFLHKYQILKEGSKIPLKILQIAKALDDYWSKIIKETTENTVNTLSMMKTPNIEEEIIVPFSWVHLLKKGQYIHISKAHSYPEYECEQYTIQVIQSTVAVRKAAKKFKLSSSTQNEIFIIPDITQENYHI